jgi:hypothetical protein
MTDDPEIDYEALTQEAMRGVMRAVLQRVATNGLPGDHHFYIAFNTRAPAVGLSRRLREKYPDEMTIVLQHRFWDLAVREDRFEVKLTFDGIPELLSIPFAAVKVFFDPSVQYGLQFEDKDPSGDPARRPIGARRMTPSENADAEASVTAPRLPGRAPAIDKKRPPRKPRPGQERAADAAQDTAAVPGSSSPRNSNQPTAIRPAALPVGGDKTVAGKPASSRSDDETGHASGEEAAERRPASEPIPKPETPGAKIVNIDNFRKK